MAVGLAVEVTDPPTDLRSTPSERTAWFETLATDRGIDAILQILGDPEPVGVDIWIFQQQSRGFRASRVVLEPGAPNPPETLAIRAIEVLRANFLVIELPSQAAQQPRSDAPSSAQTLDQETETPEDGYRFGFAAGGAVIASLDGVGPALKPMANFDLRLPAGFAVEATVSAFGTRPSVETQAGSVRVTQDYGLLGVRYSAPAGSTFAAFLALGAGAVRTSLEGSASAPNQGHQVDQWALLLQGSLGVRLGILERYTLSVAAHLQFATPYAAIHFVDQRVATTGRPNLLASLTLGAWL